MRRGANLVSGRITTEGLKFKHDCDKSLVGFLRRNSENGIFEDLSRRHCGVSRELLLRASSSLFEGSPERK